MTAADYSSVATPCFVLDEAALCRNIEILGSVQQRTGCRILLALKAFSVYKLFPLMRHRLNGVCASGPWEARLGREEFGHEIHVEAPAYSERDMAELVGCADHIVFNSCSQWQRFKPMIAKAVRPISCGLRLNPQHSEAPVEKYSPCGRWSRLGITRAELDERTLEGITGFHFHVLCEQDADAFGRSLAAIERLFGDLIPGMRWVNFGGGHQITRKGYNIGQLCKLLTDFSERYDIRDIYLEPGEAVALDAGVLVATVRDIVRNEMDIAILDTSASAHMPDVLDMPYRPTIEGAGEPGEFPHTFRLGGNTCLAGDIIGDYSFPAPLEVGQRIVFGDMAHYSIVKTTMFNGVKHPAIAVQRRNGAIDILREFTYEDYKARMA